MVSSDENDMSRERKLWWVALAAILLTLLILAILYPRSLAWTTPPFTPTPGTPPPGLYEIPTVTPKPPSTPTPSSEGMVIPYTLAS